jgi:hypothetical protein
MSGDRQNSSEENQIIQNSVMLCQKLRSKGIKSMGGGLRIDGDTNFSRRKTLRGHQNLKEEGAIQGG